MQVQFPGKLFYHMEVQHSEKSQLGDALGNTRTSVRRFTSQTGDSTSWQEKEVPGWFK